MNLFTIGHSNLEINTFISLLRKHGVTVVADVRADTTNVRLPHFRQAFLQEFLPKEGIQYVFLGQELGGQPSTGEKYLVKPDYLSCKGEAFQEAIARILNGLKKDKIALMGRRSDALLCHRSILVCRVLVCYLKAPISINHIQRDGNLESYKDFEDRLLWTHGRPLDKEVPNPENPQCPLSYQNPRIPLSDPSCMLTREEALSLAYDEQAANLARGGVL